jgi:predicted amino acid racemase
MNSKFDKSLVTLAGIAFLIITGFTAGSYYTMHKITETGIEITQEIDSDNLEKIERKCKEGNTISIKKKQYFCMPIK